MSTIRMTGAGSVFVGNQGAQILLNATNYLKNKSRISMHSLSEDGDTIPNFLIDIMKKNKNLFSNATTLNELVYCIINNLVASHLVTSAAPMKIAEFGSTNGDISYNLTEVVGKINPKSTLCLISDRIGNESSNNCLNYISQAETFPEFQMLYSDYMVTNLADGLFDVLRAAHS